MARVKFGPPKSEKYAPTKNREERLKSKPRTDLVIVESTPDKVTLSKAHLQVLDTRFGKQALTIVDMLDMGQTDGASSLVVKSLLQSVVALLPQAEQNVVASGGAKGIYGYNALITSTRELLGDLQSFKDRANIGQSIVDRSIRPAFQDIAVQIVQAMTLLSSAKDRMSKSEYAEYRTQSDEIKKSLGDYIMAQYKEVSTTVSKSLT
jgi:hypothetical protein